MNYLRGSLSAAYQYYRDLPPINASTLTGAIDVIVIQRTDEHGQNVLACTPFHVRFGKLQILRPGEKKVNVRVNGHPIPFNMKIGEAGEAFFVFETEEDVPEELTTSPILQASSPETAASDLNAQHVGRFGAKGSDSNLNDSEDSEALEEERNEDAIPEPDFLDLDAISSKPDEISVPRAGVATPSKFAPLQPISMGDKPTEPSTLLGRSTISSSDLGSTTIKAVQEGKRVGDLKEGASAAEQKLSTRLGNRLSHLKRSSTDEPSTDQAIQRGEEVPAKEDRKDPNPPVAYLGDVVIDMAGYHSKDASDATVKGGGGRINKLLYEAEVPLNVAEDAQALLIEQQQHANEITPASSPTLSPTTPSTAVSLPRSVRATSEPLELEASPKHKPSLTTHPSLQNSLPRYSWEWGGFPVQTPSKMTGFNLAHGLERGEMERTTSLPTPEHSTSPSPEPEGEMRGAIHSKDSDEDDFDINFARARLSSVGEYGYNLDVRGKGTRFELSLSGDVSTKSREEAEGVFRKDRVSFQRFIEDPKIVHRDELCILWKGRFISRKQSSPILPALVVWRQATLGNSIIQSDEEPLSSSDEREERPQQTKTLPVPTSTGGRWSRWFGRSSSRREIATTGSTPNKDGARTPDGPRPPASAPLQSTPAGEKPMNGSVPQALSNGTVGNGVQPGAATKDAKHYVKTLRLTSDQLKELNLKKGPNSITFSLSATGEATCTARIFVWDATDQIVISDIDGTITKSDALGHVFTMIGRDWTHSGVAKLYTDICRNGYKIMYLTSRAIGQADSTRDYLRGIKQNEYQLPEGPVIMSPDRLMASLHREVIMRQPEVFKMACLRDIQRLFGPVHRNPFYAGFGNRITDALSYRSVNVPSGRIFTIDSTGEVKMELLELAGYKSSYIHMTDLVDQMFPPIHRKWAPEFTDANFWRQPIAEFDFPDFRPASPQPAGTPAPPSPALSARSDASLQTGFSRLRNFSLRGGRGAPAQEFIPAGTKTNGVNGINGHQRAKSSIGQGLPSSAAAHSRHTSAGVEGMAIPRGNRNGEDTSMHRLSGGSMPGSYDGFQLDEDYDEEDDEEDEEDEEGDEDEDEDGDEEYDDEEDEEEDELPHVDEEHEFDDELLATGAMDSIPYI